MNFLKDLSGSGYWQIVRSSHANQRTRLGFESGMPLPACVSTAFRSGQSAVDLYSRGSLLSFSDVAAVVEDAGSNNVLNLVNADDPNSIWLLLPSPDVADTSGFWGLPQPALPLLQRRPRHSEVRLRREVRVAGRWAANPANRAVSPNGPMGSHNYPVQELLAPTVPQTCAQSASGR